MVLLLSRNRRLCLPCPRYCYPSALQLFCKLICTALCNYLPEPEASIFSAGLVAGVGYQDRAWELISRHPTSWFPQFEFRNLVPDGPTAVAASADAPLVTLMLHPDCGWLFLAQQQYFACMCQGLHESLAGDCASHSQEYS